MNSNAALTVVPSFNLAHKHLAHPGKDMLQLMICQKLVIGLDNVPSNPRKFNCKACICRKMTRAPFQKGHDATDKCLGCLHSDICRLMETISLGKKHYFCILVNDQTTHGSTHVL